MKRIDAKLTVLLAALTFGPALLAQPRGNFAERMQRSNQEFLQVDPQIGDPLPEVAGYTENQEKIALSDLKGSYHVIVFGCLT